MLTTETNKTKTAGDDGVTYPYDFPVWAGADLRVVISNKVAPLEKDELEYGVDFTVGGIGLAAGGNVTLIGDYAALGTPGPPDSDHYVTCIGELDFKQEVDVEDEGSPAGNTHERAWDRLTRLCQQLNERVSRCLKVDETSDEDPGDVVIQNYTLLTTTNERAPVLLDEVVASATPTADLSSSDMANHDIFELEFVNVRPATDDVGLWLRCSDDLGVSWNDDSYYNWKSVYMPDAGNTHDAEINYNDLDDRFYLVDVASTYKVPNAAYDTVSGTIRIHNLPSRPRIIGELSYSLLANAVMVKIIGGYISALDVDAFRVSFSAGAITSGSIRLWGLPTGS